VRANFLQRISLERQDRGGVNALDGNDSVGILKVRNYNF